MTQEFKDWLRKELEASFDRFNEFLTRAEVFLADENSERGGNNDKRCTIELRLKGLNPEAVTANAGDIQLAIKNATDKALQLMRNRTEKLRRV